MQAHGPLKAPDGAELVSISANMEGDEEISAFFTKDIEMSEIQHMYIVLHGKRRDADHYWTTMHTTVERVRMNRSLDRKIAIVAPIFFSTVFNHGQYARNQLAWGDLNAWQAGSRATHPSNTNVSAIDALDGIVSELSNVDRYPNMTNLTIVGHGGGGQLAQRYAALAKNPPEHVHVRYIHGDPSTSAYFTDNRPIAISDRRDDTDDEVLPSKSSCPDFNTWRYGFGADFPGTLQGVLDPQTYFRQYVSRDVVSLVGYRDVAGSGDESCMAAMQGGRKRRDRNLAWYRYVHTLARTPAEREDLAGFPGRFVGVPDWSDLMEHGSSALLRLAVVENATHDVAEVFASHTGVSALFDDENVHSGWRPKKKD